MQPLELCYLFQAQASLLSYLCLITFVGFTANEMYSLEGGISPPFGTAVQCTVIETVSNNSGGQKFTKWQR